MIVKAKTGALPKEVKITRPSAPQNADIASVRRMLKENALVIYHGNKDKNMIPTYGLGSKDNDYGVGFYTTPNKELAKEWAWGVYTQGNKAYVHTYELNIEGLNILNLTERDSIHWIAELVANRQLNLGDKEVARDNVQKLIAKYKLNTNNYDAIIGYRADDSYFAYAESFVTGTIYKDTLETALRMGDLGLQVFIKSERAFSRLNRTDIEEVPEKYRAFFVKRDKEAGRRYNELRNSQQSRLKQTIYNFIN